MICSACGYDNFSGVDICAECGQSLIQEYLVEAEEEGHNIFAKPLSVLNPRKPVCVTRDTTVAEVITLLKGKNVGCVLVVGDEGKLVGIFTERDVLYRVAGLIENLKDILVESLMTPRPTSLKASMPISHALHLMGLHGFRHVPLVNEDDKPLSSIAFRDIVHFIEKNFSSNSA
jgi:CBS domain-containing protein